MARHTCGIRNQSSTEKNLDENVKSNGIPNRFRRIIYGIFCHFHSSLNAVRATLHMTFTRFRSFIVAITVLINNQRIDQSILRFDLICQSRLCDTVDCKSNLLIGVRSMLYDWQNLDRQ